MNARHEILRPASALAVLASSILLAACGGASEVGSGPAEPDREGITLYSGRIPPLIGPAIDLFEADVDRDVQVRFGDSAQLAATIVEEGGNSPADAFFSQDAGALGALQQEGLLAKLPDRLLRRVGPAYRSEDGRWVGVSGRARVIAYDSRELDRSDLPDSVLELTEPEWKGRVGWAPTNASLQAYVTALRVVEGEEVARRWLEGMVDNDARVYESNVPVRDAIASGDIDIGLINHYYVAQAVAEHGSGYPVDVHFPPDDLGSMINVAGVGILESSDRRAEALRFVRFMLSREAQRYFVTSSHEYPMIEGIAGPQGMPPLRSIPSPDVDLSRISDLEGTLRLMRETGAL